MYTTTLKGKPPKCKNLNINNCAKSLHLRDISINTISIGKWRLESSNATLILEPLEN
jgi:hypothetical protein